MNNVIAELGTKPININHMEHNCTVTHLDVASENLLLSIPGFLKDVTRKFLLTEVVS